MDEVGNLLHIHSWCLLLLGNPLLSSGSYSMRSPAGVKRVGRGNHLLAIIMSLVATQTPNSRGCLPPVKLVPGSFVVEQLCNRLGKKFVNRLKESCESRVVVLWRIYSGRF